VCRYNRGPQYFRAEFDVKIIIGAADLKFQLWGKNGQLSKDHEEIEVLWDPPPQPLAGSGALAEDGYGMYHQWSQN
jgi:hypothetical protein